MSSIESKLNYLFGTKNEIRQAIQEKGVSVASDTTFRQYADKIRLIETGSTTPPPINLNLQEKTANPTGAQFEVTPDESYDGLSKVIVTGEVNLKPENIAYGITIYGITGTMESKPIMGGTVPSAYQSYYDQARALYTGDYKNLMILESNQAVAFGFMLDGFNVESYDENNSEFTASKWVYVAYNKSTDKWKVEDWTNATSNGNSYIKNIRYSDTYIYYGDRLIYPFLVGPEPPEQRPQTFSFTISITKTTYLELSIQYAGSGTVEWGDGGVDNLDKVTSNTHIQHAYSSIGDYTIVFNGIFTSFYVDSSKSYYINRYISKINSKFPTTIKDLVYFASNSKLVSLPEDLFRDCSSLTRLYSTFSDCTLLESIPENIFYGCGSLKTLYSTFNGCEKLKRIPPALFMPLYSLTSTYYLFSGCNILELIPANLFANSRLLKDLTGAFNACAAITVIPTGLFDNCQSLENLTDCFHATAIDSIPTGLFDNCPNITTFDNCFYGTKLKSIPDGIFKNCLKAVSFFQCFGNTKITSIPADLFSSFPKGAPLNLDSMFSRCSSLKEMPSNLLDGFTNIQDISNMFFNCTGITGALPEWWNDSRFDSVPHTDCFRNCSSASNYADVPTEWK